MYIYMWVCYCGCCCGSVIITGLIVLLIPQRKHCSKMHSLHKHTPYLHLTRYIMSARCPVAQITITLEPWRQLQKVHLRLLGPGTLWDPNSQTVAQLQSHTGMSAHYTRTETGEWTTHKALTGRHAAGEKQIEMGGRRGRGGWGREGCGNGE